MLILKYFSLLSRLINISHLNKNEPRSLFVQDVIPVIFVEHVGTLRIESALEKEIKSEIFTSTYTKIKKVLQVSI